MKDIFKGESGILAKICILKSSLSSRLDGEYIFFSLDQGPCLNTYEEHFKRWTWYLGCNVSFGFQFHQNRIRGGFFYFFPIFEFEFGTYERQ